MKQLAYSQFDFVSVDEITQEQILVRLQNGIYVNRDNITLLTPIDTGNENTYRVVIWTNDVLENDIVDLYIGVSGGMTPYQYHGKIVATFTDFDYVIYRDKAYETTGSVIIDKYTTDAGYVDYSKVALSSKDIMGDPYSVIDIITDQEVENYIVLEGYTSNDISYTRVSEFAVAYTTDVNVNDTIPETAQLYYDVDDNIWYEKTINGWIETNDFVENGQGDIIYNGVNYVVVEGKSYVIDDYMSFRWDHYADKDKRIDPSTSNIVDVYVLSSDYVRRINEWKASGYITSMPLPPTSYELNELMTAINDKAAIADHVSYIPAKFKFLFGEFADEENKAIFKVIKKAGTNYTESEVKSKVAEKANEYFDLNRWDFGETFYFSELAAYLHMSLSDYIASVVIAPKYSTYDFKDMLSITCEPNEIFMSLVSSANVKIIDKLTNDDLIGE